MESPQNPNSGHRKRLRARYMKTGLSGFHDYEALELLLTFAIPRRDVKPLAKGLMKRFGSIKGVIDADAGDVTALSGIGENAADLIALVGYLRRAYFNAARAGKRPIRSPEDVVEFALSRRWEGECFLAVYLNSKNEVLGAEVLHAGGVEGVSITPRGVFEKAFEHNARSVIFVHDNRQCAISPSAIEKTLIKRLEAAAAAIDMPIFDHVMIGRKGHLSAREAGWLKGA